MPQPPDAAVRGFLPDDEGLQLYQWALASTASGPLLEIGSYCGRSTIWLGQAAQARQTAVFAIDHHRGSEEHQIGESHHDATLVNAEGLFDTFAAFRRNIAEADLEHVVIPIVAEQSTLRHSLGGPIECRFYRWWSQPRGSTRRLSPLGTAHRTGRHPRHSRRFSRPR